MEMQNNQNKPIKRDFNSIMQGIKDYFDSRPKFASGLLYGGITLFILALFAILLAIYGVYPFGDAMISSYDMSAQIAPFIEHFYDVFEGKTSLFYSYAIAGGADVFGTLAYCCVSPFTFIFLFFGKGNVYYGTSIVLPLKIVCVALSALYYVRKRFPEIHPFMQIILALSFAFCGYLFVANTYINWVDLLIYLPFVALGFEKMIKTGKKWGFAVPFALMIYACFSITCFSMFLIFPIVVLYCLLVVEKSNSKKALVNCVWGFILTIALALPILVPALRAFLVSGRKTSIFENLNASYSETALYKKASYLFTDGVTLFFTLAYFVKNGVKRPIDKFLAISGVILFIPVIVDESMNLLNFGSYMSYSLRFGFLNGFYFFFVACNFTLEFAAEMKANDNKVKLKNNLLFGCLLGALTLGSVVGLVFMFEALESQTFSKYFPSRFAHSEGGLEATAIIFACIAIIALLGGLFINMKKISPHVFVAILLVLTCTQTSFYSASLISGNRNVPTKFEQIGALTDYAMEIEEGNYTRVKMNGDYLTSDMALTLHTNSYSVFSSVIDNRNFTAPNFFGYSGNKKNQMRSYGGKILGDAIFGNKYVINDGNLSSTYDSLEKVPGSDNLTDKNGNKLDTGKYTLYENKLALPHAYAVKNAKTAIEEEGLHADYDGLLKMLGGESLGIVLLEPDVIEIIDEEAGEGVYRLKVPISAPGNYYVVTNFENVHEIKYTRSLYNEKEAKLLVDSPELSLGHTYSKTGTYSVYFKSQGKILTKDQIKASCTAFAVLDDNIQKLYDMASAQTVDFVTSKDGIKVSLTAEKGEYLFLNYVALPGHVAYVNGEKREMEENVLNFMLVKLDEGENRVEIVYNSPYVKLILVGAVLAFSIVAVCLFVEKKKRIYDFLAPVVYWAAIGLSAALAVFYLVMPTVVCAYKLVLSAVRKIIGLF